MHTEEARSLQIALLTQQREDHWADPLAGRARVEKFSRTSQKWFQAEPAKFCCTQVS